MPDPLEVQVPIILEVLDAFGICVVGADGYEADDVIGTLATGAGMPVDVVTGDRDLFQLVDDEADVRVLYIARGVGNHERVDRRRRCVEKYGVDCPASTPTSPPCAATPPTGCPASPGVGEKTAATLLLKFGDLARHRRGRRGPRLRHGARARAARSWTPRTTSRSPRRSSRSPATSTSAGYDATLPASPRTRSLEQLAERYNLGSAVPRLIGVLAG